MKKNKKKLTIFLGVLCVLLMAVSSWYTITYNDSRIIKQMELSEYTFRIKDLPMIISTVLSILYIIYLFVLLAQAIIANKYQVETTQSTRTISPKFGLFGLFGFFGFLGFWTYSVDKTIFPFIFFMFFGFFGFFYEGKMSNTFMDERYKENKMKAHMTADKTALGIIFFTVIVLVHRRLIVNPEYILIAIVIVVALALALDMFLGEYLLYRYDYNEQLDESEE